MQITVTVPDEFASRIQALGLTPEGYVERLIAEQTGLLKVPVAARELDLDEFNASLDALARYSDKIPSLPVEAFSRESFYENHD